MRAQEVTRHRYCERVDLVGIAGGVYLFWWFMIELSLPGSFNPLPGRLLVVGLDAVLLAASYASRWVEQRLSALFTGWACLLVAHYCYLVIGNHGDSTGGWVRSSPLRR